MRYSILIPAYKARFLAEAITSCLEQSFADFELIIVDDASPENLGQIVDKFQDPRIRYYVNKENFGAINVVDNWNQCLSYAKGDFVICMGDDDKLLPDCLGLYNELIDKYPDLEIYHVWTQIINEASQVIDVQESRPEWESALSAQYYRWDHRWKQYIGDFCFRVESLRTAGGFYKLPLAWGADDVSVFRAAKYKGIANTQKFGFQYRRNRQTITNSGNQQIKASAHAQERDWFKNQISNYTCHTPEDEFFRSMLLSRIDSHYHNKILDMLDEDIRISIMNIKFWLDNCLNFGLTKSQIWSRVIHMIRVYKTIRF